MSVFHGGEVRFEGKEGILTDYNPALVSIKSGEKTEQNRTLESYSVKNKTGDKKQYMPNTLSEETPILMEKGSHHISISPTDETLKAAGTENAKISIKKELVDTAYESEEKLPVTALYAKSGSTADFAYTSANDGIKETLTLNQIPQSNVFKYRLNTGSLKARKNAVDEGITIFDDENEDIAAYISPAWMDDATGDAYSEDITYDIEPENEEGIYTLTMTVSREYLDSEERQYPVTIDPSTTWSGSSKVKDAYVISGSYGSTNFFSSSTKVMPAGKNGTGTHQTFIKFTDLKTTISGQSVTSAKFTAYEVAGGASKQKVSIYRIAKSWSPSSITWNNRPTCVSGALSTVTSKKAAHAAHTFDVLSYAKGVAAGTMTDYGLALKNTTASPSYTSFFGSRATSYKPKLVITYYSKPTTATSASISPAYVKKSSDAKITYAGITSTGLARVEYRVYSHDDTAGINTVKLDYSSARKISSGASLPALDEGCYVFAVRGFNTAEAAGTEKKTGVVHVDSTPPNIEEVSLSPSTKANPGPSSPQLTWSVIEPHLKSISYKVDNQEFKSIEAVSSGSFTIPKSEIKTTGRHEITLKAEDKAGNSAEKIIEDYYVYMDGPDIGNIKLIDRWGLCIKEGDWSREDRPTVSFSDVGGSKSSITEDGITYAITTGEGTPGEADYHSPEEMTCNEADGKIEGSFRLTESEKIEIDGTYCIFVRFTNAAGNFSEKKLMFNRDSSAPSGSISITAEGSAGQITILKDTVIVTGSINDADGSGIKDSNIIMYEASRDGEEITVGDRKCILYKDTRVSNTRPLNTTKYSNGEYILRLTVEYDALKRMTSYKEWSGSEEPEEPTGTYTYDIDGNVTRIDYADLGSDLKALKFEYSNIKRLLKIKADTGGILDDTLREYEYDAQNRVSKIKDYYNFTGSNDYLEKTYTYDAFGRVTSMAYRGGAGHDEIKEAYIYTYDKNSNILSERIVSRYNLDEQGHGIDKTRSYTYDALGRLTSSIEVDTNTGEEEVTTYTYDGAGNRLTETKDGKTTSYTYNSLNQLTEARETGAGSDTNQDTESVYSYDRNGNQVSEITTAGTADTERKAFTYDEANRLSKLTIRENDAVVLTQNNTYNGDGQRIEREETKLVTSPEGATEKTAKTEYFYQDGAVLYTKDAAGDITSMNLMGAGGNVISTSRMEGEKERWHLYNKDIRNSTSSIVGSDGEAVATYEYDDFGNTIATSSEDFDNEICYTGQIYDRSSGLYYYNARYYDPQNGRFITQDTYRGENTDPNSLHLYAYCTNNPINYVDPSGHNPIALGIAGVGAALIYAAIKTGEIIFIGGLAWIAISKLTEIKKKKRKTYYYKATIHKGYVYFRDGLSKKTAVTRLRHKKNVLATTAKRAKAVCKSASPLRLAQYEDAHKKQCGYRKHYHPVKKNREKNKRGQYKNRIKAHCFY